MTNNVDISIIYVYYNSADVIFNSINSIIINNTDITYEIIVVINKMDDCSIEKFKDYENLKVIINDNNYGFGRANNIGFQESTGKYILLLNPDTIITENTIRKIIYLMENEYEIGLSNCKLLDMQGNIQKNVIYKKYNLRIINIELFFLYKFPVIKKLVKNNFYDLIELEKDQLYPTVISGAFMMFRREVFEKLDGFDEDFFMYGEDKNLCLRANKITKIKYYPEVEAIHIGATTLGKEPSEMKLKFMIKGMLLNFQKLYGKNMLSLFKINLLLNAVIMLPVSFLLRNNTYKNLLKIRSKVILKELIHRK